MPLQLTTPKQIKTGFLIDLTKLGSRVEILSLTFRLKERAVLVEYRIVADDNSGRDHHSAVVVPIDTLETVPLKKLLKEIYGELKKLPDMNGSVSDDEI